MKHRHSTVGEGGEASNATTAVYDLNLEPKCIHISKAIMHAMWAKHDDLQRRILECDRVLLPSRKAVSVKSLRNYHSSTHPQGRRPGSDSCDYVFVVIIMM
jgi:hypothetical protein